MALGSIIRYCLHPISADRHLSIGVLLTTVITIGGITMMFALVHSILIEPLPYPDSDRLVLITQDQPGGETPHVNEADYYDIVRESTSFEAIGMYNNGSLYRVGDGTDTQQVTVKLATPEIFSILGIDTVLGRGLLPEHAAPESPAVAVLDYGTWQRLGAREDIVGTTLRLSSGGGALTRDIALTVVGVISPDFEEPAISFPSEHPVIWRALQSSSTSLNRRGRTMNVLGKLREGVNPAAAREELRAIDARLTERFPETNAQRTTSAKSLLDSVVSDARSILQFLFAAVCGISIIGVGNLIVLQTCRNQARMHELSIRTALGATPRRLFQHVLSEAAALSFIGLVLAVPVAWAGVVILRAAIPARFPRANEIGFSIEVLAFAAGIATLVAVAVAAVSVWKIRVPDRLPDTLKEAASILGGRRSRVQRGLLALEVALAFVLCVGAALLAHSYWRLINVDIGLNNEDNLWSVEVTLPPFYQSREQTDQFWNAVLDRLRSLPDVESAAIMSGPLLNGADMRLAGVVPEGSDMNPRSAPLLSNRAVAPGFFQTIGLEVVRGRPILESDTAGAELVAVLNERAAELLWPGQDPIGKRLVNGPPIRVVGVVSNFRHIRLDDEPIPQIYTPQEQSSTSTFGFGTVLVRLDSSGSGFGEIARYVIRDLEQRVELDVATIFQLRWRLVASERLRTGLLLVFAAGAGILAVIGIYSVVSFSVIQRQREIGLRLALGSSSGGVRRLVMREAMLPALIGLGVGLVVALGMSDVVSGYVYEIRPTDVATYAITVVVVLVTVLIAAYLPAGRAVKLDPIVLLRPE